MSDEQRCLSAVSLLKIAWKTRNLWMLNFRFWSSKNRRWVAHFERYSGLINYHIHCFAFKNFRVWISSPNYKKKFTKNCSQSIFQRAKNLKKKIECFWYCYSNRIVRCWSFRVFFVIFSPVRWTFDFVLRNIEYFL